MPKVITIRGNMRFMDVKFAAHLEKRMALIRDRLMVLIDETTGADREKAIRRFRRMMDIEVRVAVATLDYLE